VRTVASICIILSGVALVALGVHAEHAGFYPHRPLGAFVLIIGGVGTIVAGAVDPFWRLRRWWRPDG